jgi:hypothetical protein
MAELNCIQKRNPGAGFVREHGKFCAFDRSEGIDHGLASRHLNLGHWCGNICEACATDTRRKYRPDQLDEGTHQVVVVTAPRQRYFRRPEPTTTFTEEAETEVMMKK